MFFCAYVYVLVLVFNAVCCRLCAAQFNQKNGIDLICRAHQLVMEGYKMHFKDTVATVWSAPNYCYRCGNVAAILELDEHLARNFKIFEAAPQETRGVPAKRPQADYFL
eukprot:Opistho-1_new@68435